jgi:predicted TPR repeat methyltransferase
MLHKDRREYARAIECFLNCVKHGQVTPEILSILGQLFYLTGQFQKSRDAYQLAADADPSNINYRKMLDETQFVCLAMDNGNLDEPLKSLSHPEADDLLHKTFALLSAYGHTNAARRVAEKRVDFSPASATAAYLLHAIDGNAAVTRSPDDFLIESFDAAAERFDAHLVSTLGYDIPQKLAEGMARFIPKDSRLDLLDAGCGTGLCGPWVKPFSKSLIGVDLSPKMLDQARKRQIYDQLVCAELTTFLLDSTSRFNAIIAADVMIYFGDLTPLANAIATSLRPGGILAFSTESASAPGHHLLGSGRFSHHPDYIRSIFCHHLIECHFEQTIIRQEAKQPVAGNLFLFRRT